MKDLEPIREFKDEFAFLSNFHPSPIGVGIDLIQTSDNIIQPKLIEWIDFPTVEHAYQAFKTHDIGIRKGIASLEFPGQAKKFGRKIEIRPDWETVKVFIMFFLLSKKFDIPNLSSNLLLTGKRELIEGNWWGDKFWGICLKTNEGHNVLGKLLMEIRNGRKASL